MKIVCARMGPIETNCYLLIDDTTGKAAVIDPAAPGPELWHMLEEPGVFSVEYIILTHRHYDHILGTAALRKKTGAKVLVGEKDAKALTDPLVSLAAAHGYSQEPVAPARLLREGDHVLIGALDVMVLHTPGHTAGGISLVVEDVIFSGDTLFALSMGRTDLPSGSEEDIFRSLRKLSQLPGDYRVLPGHGSETQLEFERRNNPFMRG